MLTAVHEVVLAQIGSVPPSAPPGNEKYVQVLSWVVWVAVIATMFGFVIAAAMLAYQRWSGGGGDAQTKLVAAMIGAALISMSGTIFNTILL